MDIWTDPRRRDKPYYRTTAMDFYRYVFMSIKSGS
jgi:hypothetical protein